LDIRSAFGKNLGVTFRRLVVQPLPIKYGRSRLEKVSDSVQTRFVHLLSIN